MLFCTDQMIVTLKHNRRLYKALSAFTLVCLLIYLCDVSRWLEKEEQYGEVLLPLDKVLHDSLSQNTLNVSNSIFNIPHNITYKKVELKKRKKKKKRKKYDEVVPNVKVSKVNCSKIFAADVLETMKGAEVGKTTHIPPHNTVQLLQLLSTPEGCHNYLTSQRFIDQALNDEEADFPIAFSLIIYKDFFQFERLLRAIYRPQNFYCIHIDAKVQPWFRDLVTRLSNCFPSNRVFVTEKRFDVRWAHISVLQTEVLCAQELWRRFAVEEVEVTIHSPHQPPTKVTRKRPKWRYFINLTGQEFPLRSNWELVRVLKMMRGANGVEGTTARMHETLKKYYLENKPYRGIIIHKGSVHVALSREAIDFMLHHPLPSSLLTSLRSAYIPDEYFFSTLNYNPRFGFPGSYTGNVTETDPVHNRFITRFKNWAYDPFAWPCKGSWIRQICNFGVGDLPLLSSRDELFANKFDITKQPISYDCMEEAMFDKIRREYKEEEDKANGVKVTKKMHTKKSSVYATTPRPWIFNPRKTNPDHVLFPDIDFASYGDSKDGTFLSGKEADKLRVYLKQLRPTVYRPLEVEMEHYKDLAFVKHHKEMPQDWVYLYDDHFELKVNDKYNQTKKSYLGG